jgi:hypothetical protein
MELIILITIIILILSCIKIIEGFSNEVIYVKSRIDNRKYLVQNLNNKQEAADMLALLRQKLIKFTNHIYQVHKIPKIKRLKMKYKPNNLTEGSNRSGYTSYNINKGQKIVFCIRERDEKNNLVDENTIFFVALHELAHIMTYSVGHKKEFWNNFRFLLKFAIKHGYYTYIPYHNMPQKYCGIIITDTPLKL